MTLRNIGENEQVSYENYSFWLMSLLSFASGNYVEKLYKFITVIDKNGSQIKSEYWSGRKLRSNRRGIVVIEPHNLPLFINQCARKLTDEIFINRGLNLSLNWYINTFNNNVVEVDFLLLCTALESLIYRHFKESSERLVSTKKYREVKKKILEIINNSRLDINEDEELRKYDIFARIIQKPFDDGSCNKIGSLSANTEKMLDDCGVPYKDLFPKVDFIKIRNTIIHRGINEIDNNFIELRKLSTLIVRIFIVILGYEGKFMESRKIELYNESEISKYGLICVSLEYIFSQAKNGCSS